MVIQISHAYAPPHRHYSFSKTVLTMQQKESPCGPKGRQVRIKTKEVQEYVFFQSGVVLDYDGESDSCIIEDPILHKQEKIEVNRIFELPTNVVLFGEQNVKKLNSLIESARRSSMTALGERKSNQANVPWPEGRATWQDVLRDVLTNQFAWNVMWGIFFFTLTTDIVMDFVHHFNLHM